MARNKRKNLKDKEKLKGIRIEAKKRWRNKQAEAKRLNHAVEQAVVAPQQEKKSVFAANEPGEPSVSCLPCERLAVEQAVVATEEEKDPAVASNDPGEPSVSCLPRERTDKRPVQVADAGGPEIRKAAETRRTVRANEGESSLAIKEINPSEVVRANKLLGCGSFGTCHLAYYRGILVAVKEFKPRQSRSTKEIKRELFYEAKMINHLGDHRGLPLLFGVISKSRPLRLVTQFHGDKSSSVTLHKAIRRVKLEKPCWLGVLRGVIEALSHVHHAGIMHNDLKSNNVVLEKRGKQWNPVIIDFGKARFITNPKPLISMSSSAQEQYRHSYPHIAPEIVRGEGQQSVASDVFSLGRIALDILNLLPTATALSLNTAKKAISDDPAKRPSLSELLLYC